jgi:hypothetical protein
MEERNRPAISPMVHPELLAHNCTSGFCFRPGNYANGVATAPLPRRQGGCCWTVMDRRQQRLRGGSVPCQSRTLQSIPRWTPSELCSAWLTSSAASRATPLPRLDWAQESVPIGYVRPHRIGASATMAVTRHRILCSLSQPDQAPIHLGSCSLNKRDPLLSTRGLACASAGHVKEPDLVCM